MSACSQAFLTICTSTSRQATFKTSTAPGHRQISRIVSAPSLHYDSPLFRCPAELQGTSCGSSNACHSDKTTGKVHDHQHDHDIINNVVTLSEGIQVDQQRSERATQRYNDPRFRGNFNDEAARLKEVSRQAIKSDRSISPPTIFLWKGHNYLVKMAHDLDFLDNENVAAPVSAWLGFPIHRNPFLIPPEGHDICKKLQRGHEERCKERAARRRQRQQHQHRLGGTGSGQRKFSRSRSRSRANSGTNRPRGSGDGDLSASCPSGLSGHGQQNEPVCDLGKNAGGSVVPPKATAVSQHQQHQPVQDADSNATENDVRQRAGSTTNMTLTIALPGDEEAGKTFVTEGGMTMADGSLGSVSTSVEPPVLWGLGDLEDEDIPCELSSGEEEEVQWNGGGYLGVPIIPDLPEAIRSKALTAAETLRSEDATEEELESNALEILANAKRTQEILHQPDQEHSSRVERLAERSARNGLRGALVDRHVGATRLKSVASMSCWPDEALSRRASTAPPGGVGAVQRQRTRNSFAGWAVAKSAPGRPEDHDQNSAALGTSRGGVCVAVDGGAENGDIERTHNTHEPPTSAPLHRLAGGSRDSTSRRGGASTSRSRRPDRTHVGVSEGTTGSVSAASLAERSTAASSLQASSSNMSARARARATAARPTAMRRPFCRNGGRIIITDPGKSAELRHKAAMLIQAAFLAASARCFVRRLRDNRECAALLVGQNWRRSRVRLRMWNAKRLRRAEELRQVAESKARNRAAHLLQTFFRDIKYRQKRVRYICTGVHS